MEGIAIESERDEMEESVAMSEGVARWKSG
jgi:hypothetical protein